MKDTIGRVFYAGLPTPLAMGIVEANSTINTGGRWVDQINKTPVEPRGDIWHVYHDDGSYTTIASPATEGGKFYEYQGKQYLVADSFLHLEFVTQQYKNLEGQDVDHKQLVSLSDRYETTHEIPLNQVVTSKVDDLGGLFQDANNFNQDISSWDTSAVFNLNSIFYGASTFNQNISNWDVSKVTDFESTVDGCYDFNQDLSKWDVSSGETFTYMFYGCYSFDYDLSGWCTPAAVEYEDFNYDAYLLTEERLPIWGECPGPIRIVNHKGGTLALRFDMGEGLGSGQNIWIKSIVFTEGVDGSISYTVPLGDVIALDNGNVHWNPTWSDDFGALSLDDLNYNNSITITNFGNVPSGVTHVHIDINQLYGADGTLSIVDAVDTNLVYGQYEFTPDPEVESTDLQTDFTSPKPNSRTVKASDTAVAGTLYDVKGEWFYVAKDRDDLVGVLRKFVTETEQLDNKVSASVTDDFGNTQQVTCDALATTFVTAFNDLLFDTKNKFNQDVSSWDTSNVTNMERVFRASTHFNQDLSKWDVSKVTTFRGMFQYCDDFNQNITGWDVSSATDLSEMFDGAATFNQDISGWDTSNVVNTSRMFLSSPIAIDLSMWCVPNVTDYTDFATYAPNMTPEFTPVWGTCPSYIAVRTSTNGTGETLYALPGAQSGRHYKFRGEWHYVVGDTGELSFLLSQIENGGGGGGDEAMSYSMLASGPEGEVEITDITGLKAFISSDRIVTTRVTDMGSLFSGKWDFDMDVSNWDTSNVVNMSYMFGNSSSFTSDLSGWDTSSVTDMSSMFKYSNSFTADLSGWDTSSVVNMSSLLENTNQWSGDISTWNTISVTDLSNAFKDVYGATLDISGWDTSNVTNMRRTFYSMDMGLDISAWNTGNVTDMSEMFRNTKNFTADLSGWDVSSVTDMNNMFNYSPTFNSDISAWNTVSLTDSSNMFNNAHNFNSDISAWNVSSLVNMNNMFFAAYLFDSDLSGWDVSSVVSMATPFVYTTLLQTSLTNWDTGNVVDMQGLFGSFDLSLTDLSGWDVSSVTNMENLFSGDMAGINQDLSAWDVSKVQNMKDMFGWTKNVDFNISTWNTASVLNMSGMFNNVTGVNVDISAWNTGNVTDMGSMFSHLEGMVGDISGWDTSNVTNMYGMFDGSGIPNQNLNAWDVSNVTNMQNMFQNTQYINCDLNGWNTGNVTNMNHMFSYNQTFNGNVGAWDVSKVTDMNSVFYSAKSFNQDLSAWCVSHHPTKPVNFDGYTNSWFLTRPIWGVCGTTLTSSPYITKVVNPRGGYTVKALPGATPGKFHYMDGEWYYVLVDINDLKGRIYQLNTDNDRTDGTIVLTDKFNNTQALPTNNVVSTLLTDLSGAFYHNYGNSFDGDISMWDTSNVTDMSWMFSGCHSFNQPIGTWDTSKVTNMSGMFNGAAKYNQTMDGWDTSKVTDMSSMFSGALEFNQPLTSFNTSNVVDMGGMFSKAEVFNQPLASFNTSNVVDMGGMFRGAKAFNQPIGTWVTNKVVDMNGMFEEAILFNQPLEGWNTIGLRDARYLFNDAVAFNQNIGQWRVGRYTGSRIDFDKGAVLWTIPSWKPQWGVYLPGADYDADNDWFDAVQVIP